MFEIKKTRKRKLKLPSAITILFLLVVLIVLISWIPGTTGNYPTGKDDQGKEIIASGHPAGIFDIFIAPIKGFGTKLPTILFVIILGGFINVVTKTEALDASIGCLTAKMKGKEIWIIPIIMFLFSVGGTTYGMGEETIALYPVIIPVLLAAGFDIITAVLTILLGAGIGCAGSIINPFVIGVSLPTDNHISTSSGIIWRVFIWLLITAVTIAFVMWYAVKVKRQPSFSPLFEKKAFYQSTFSVQSTISVFTKRKKAIMAVFSLTFLVMIASLISYSSFGLPTVKMHDWVTNNIPYISSLFPNAFGDFSLIEVSAIFLFSTIIIEFISRDSEKKFVNNFFEGSSSILSVCLVIATASGIGYIMINTGMQYRLVSAIAQPLKKLGTIGFLIVAFLFFILISIFIPSTSGFATAVMPIIGKVADGVHVGLWSGTITVFSLANGLVNLFAPTSFIMMAALSISKVPIDKYFKATWKYLIGITILMLVLIIIGSLLPITNNGIYF